LPLADRKSKLVFCLREVTLVEKITEEFVEKILIERRQLESSASSINDLELYLHALPYYKPRPEGGTTEQKPWSRDIVLHNATVFVDNPYNMCHQGDITVETLRDIRERIGKHKVYIFWEHNPHKPLCGPFDLTALNPTAGMARPFGKSMIILEMADIILEGKECTINNEWVGLKKNCERAGFKVYIKPPF
jgi:hypothetical protein